MNTVNSLKEDLERKARKIREMERLLLENKLPSSSENNSINKSGGSKINHTDNSSSLGKLREKIIKNLEGENKRLKDKLNKYREENIKKKENEKEMGNNEEKSLVFLGINLFTFIFFYFLL